MKFKIAYNEGSSCVLPVQIPRGVFKEIESGFQIIYPTPGLAEETDTVLLMPNPDLSRTEIIIITTEEDGHVGSLKVLQRASITWDEKDGTDPDLRWIEKMLEARWIEAAKLRYEAGDLPDEDDEQEEIEVTKKWVIENYMRDKPEEALALWMQVQKEK